MILQLLASLPDRYDYGSLIRGAIFFFSLILILYLIRGRKRLGRKRYRDPRPLAPDLWFYSRLVDIELGTVKPKASLLMKLYCEYLGRKFEASPAHVRKILEAGGDDPDLAPYLSRWREMENLKRNDGTSVITYVKEIKFEYAGSVSPKLEQESDDEPCNNC